MIFDLISLFYSQISFQIVLDLNNAQCGQGSYDPIDNFDEGVELSIRLLSAPDEWIPVAFIFLANKKGTQSSTEIGSPNRMFAIRGYFVEHVRCVGVGRTNISIKIGNISTTDAIQFRWLQTSVVYKSILRDVWIIDNIAIIHVASADESQPLLCDSFESSTLE